MHSCSAHILWADVDTTEAKMHQHASLFIVVQLCPLMLVKHNHFFSAGSKRCINLIPLKLHEKNPKFIKEKLVRKANGWFV